MSGGLERFDIRLRFLNGPLKFQGEVEHRGPVVRLGAEPGPGELKLDGYRGLEARHATITAYDRARVEIAPVGHAQVRLAPHEYVNWSEVLPLGKPAHLTPGAAVHLGPPERGATFVFIDARRLGEWQRDVIRSEAEPGAEATRVETIEADRGVPRWFLPAVFGCAGMFMVGLFVIGGIAILRDIEPLVGPQYDGPEKQDLEELVDLAEVNERLYGGMDGVFHDFVVGPSAKAAGWEELSRDKKLWDMVLYKEVVARTSWMAKNWSVWSRFEAARDRYAESLVALRDAGLPDTFAAIPFQESGYTANAKSPACALGWWQFMPEVGVRAGMRVERCDIPGREPYTPPAGAPHTDLYTSTNADTGNMSCRIRSCAVDERTDFTASTRGAVTLLGEAWQDEGIAASGAAVAVVIASHNAGYDDARFGRKSRTQLKWALQAYTETTGKPRAPEFFGKMLTCRYPPAGADTSSKTCGGYLHRETQNYVPVILAYQALAACYYGKNYADSSPVFRAYGDYTVGDGYCAGIDVPTPEAVKSHKPKGPS